MDSETPARTIPATIQDWFDRALRADPDKVFIESIDQARAVSYRQAGTFFGRLGAYMKDEGFAANDRVALLANNSIEHLLIYYGVMIYGATVCTIHVEMNSSRLGELIGAIRPRLILYEDGLEVGDQLPGRVPVYSLGTWGDDKDDGFVNMISGQPAADLPAPVNGPEDTASIFYTSGTTSTPKGILCTFERLENNVQTVMSAFDIRREDRILDYRSFNWMSGQTLSALGALCLGATLIFAQKFSRSRLFEWMATYEATVVAGNPTVFNMLLNDQQGAPPVLPSLRFMTSSSAPLSVQEWKRFEDRFGIPVVQGFGASEIGWIAAATTANKRMGSAGRPLAYHQLKIVDESGRELPRGDIGYIEVGGDPDQEFGYLTSAGTVDVTARGRLRTGDMGYLDGDGYLFLTGRATDLIIRGGVNISPVEVDNVMNLMPGINDAASFGVPDNIYGEEVAACVVAGNEASLSEADVIDFCRGKMADVKLPKSVRFVAELPKTERGKLNRKALIRLWQEKG